MRCHAVGGSLLPSTVLLSCSANRLGGQLTRSRKSLHLLQQQRREAGTSSSSSASDGPLHLVILGAPGAGKGTQTESLLKKYPVKALIVGNLLRDEVKRKTDVGQRAAQVMRSGGLLDDATVLEIVKPGLRALDGQSWILDGYPRTAQQAKDLDKAMSDYGQAINLVVELDVPDEVLIDRIENRWIHLASGRVYNTTWNPPKRAGIDDVTGEPLIKRMDDTAEVFQKRLDNYHSKNRPILDYYREQGALVTLSGKTSAEIWPKLEKTVNERFPQIRPK